MTAGEEWTDAGVVVAVNAHARHRFSKEPRLSITLTAGLGVEGDAHYGATVQHRSRKRWHPELPNLRQVHLLPLELLEQLTAEGFDVAPGDLGENLTTRGVDLLALPTGARLRFGGADTGTDGATSPEIEITGLRNPCVQIDRFRDGLMKRLIHTDASGAVIRLAGVMAVVLRGGEVDPAAPIQVALPAGPRVPLSPV